MLVVAHHCAGFKFGYAGVTFFFVLSGFVLTYSHRDEANAVFDRRTFWLKRVARIYPTHILTLIISIPLMISHGLNPKGSILIAGNALLLQSWIPTSGGYFSGNPVAWSISDEAFFYALFPFLCKHPVRHVG